MTTKVQRQGAVAQLIADHDVTSHTQLVALLKKAGIVATQATVSRDLEEIGAVKVRTSHGETAYAIPEFEPDRIAPRVGSPPPWQGRVCAQSPAQGGS